MRRAYGDPDIGKDPGREFEGSRGEHRVGPAADHVSARCYRSSNGQQALGARDVVSGDVGRAYMPVSMVAMIALIVYRRSEYHTAAASHA